MPAPPDPVPAAGPTAPLWAAGAIRLRVAGEGGAGRVVRVDRPFALVGRLAGADVRIDDHAVSGRHAYLHLDRRGLYAVDLATRTGTRFNGVPRSAGWLRPGDRLEFAGHRVDVLEVRLGDRPLDPAGPEPADDLLADAGPAPLARVTLYPNQAPWQPRSLGSELVFLGRGVACGVRVEAATASRIHGVIVRAPDGAYAVDLIGRGTWLNGQPLPGAAPLQTGDVLAVGSARFDLRVEPTVPRAAGPPAPAAALPVELATIPPPLPIEAWTVAGPATASPVGGLAPEVQGAMLAWVAQIVQAGQAETLRRQGEFQLALTELVRQIYADNAAVMGEHLDRMDRINQEIAALRDEIRRRLGPAAAAAAGSGPAPPPLPTPPPCGSPRSRPPPTPRPTPPG